MKDYIKLLILFLIYLICLYSGIKKFIFLYSNTSLTPQYTLKYDYKICDKYSEENLIKCKEIVKKGNEISLKECKKYLNQFELCLKTKLNNCNIQKENVERCTNIVADNYIKNHGYETTSK